MIATISPQPQHPGMHHHHRHVLSLTANAAGDPLPLMPRRPQTNHITSPSWPRPLSPHTTPAVSASSSRSPSHTAAEPSIPDSASVVTITPATPPKTESDSDGTPLRHGKKRKRDLHLRVPNPTALYPPKLSPPMPTLRSHSSPTLTSTPISKNSARVNANANTNATSSANVGVRAPVIYTPGIPLRLSMESLRNVSAVGLSLHSVQSLRPSSPVSESLSSSSSLSSISVASTGGSQASPSNTPLIRKKSGQVVRPSLKSSSSYSASRSASNLGITSPNLSLPSSKSEPVTPFTSTTPTSSKAVHFDKNLERVKLFLTEQKPLAVSREGSPGDTDEGETSGSGTETNEVSRFFGVLNPMDSVGTPRCPFGTAPRCTTKLLMHTNLPSRSFCLSSSSPDATLESFLLAKGDKSIQGVVLVRNIAYDKSVTARFSFDGWCTTSEVNAKWKEGVGATAGGCSTDWDRFEFTIWLGDLKLGEEKSDSRKLELAVRYRVASKGYELWDNNEGHNYVATFERPGLLEEKARGRRARFKKKVPPVPFSDDELSDLLEKVASSKTTRKARSISPTVSNAERMTLDSSPSNSAYRPAALHTRTRSFPFSASSSPPVEPTFGWMEKSPPPPLVTAWLTKNRMFENQRGQTPQMMSPNRNPPATPTTLGSPRDLTDDTFHPRIKFPTILSNNPDESMDDSRPEEGRKMRRLQHGGYFDFPPEQLNAQESTSISRKHVREPAEQTTPTPPPSSRFHSFPPLTLTFRDSTGPREDRQPLGQSEGRVNDLPMDVPQAISISSQSTASFVGQGQTVAPCILPSAVESNLVPQSADDTSDSSSSTSTLLENESPTSSRSSTPPSEVEESDILDRTNDPDDRELYKEFLNRFCFFTGPGSPSSVSNNIRLDQVKMKESSSESSTPTLTPSGSGSI